MPRRKTRNCRRRRWRQSYIHGRLRREGIVHTDRIGAIRVFVTRAGNLYLTHASWLDPARTGRMSVAGIEIQLVS